MLVKVDLGFCFPFSFRFFFFVSDTFAFLPTASATVFMHLSHEVDRENN